MVNLYKSYPKLQYQNLNYRFNFLSNQRQSIHTNKMSLILDPIINGIKQHFFELLAESHAFIINHFFQTLFFTLAIYRVIMLGLKMINLFFAEYIWTEVILKLMIFALFLYVKIWDTYSVHLQILGYICSISISVHLYAGCRRLGGYLFNRNKGQYGNLSIVMSTILIFLAYKIFSLSQFQGQNKPKYEYVAVYFFLLLAFIAIGIIRNQLIYAMIIMITMGLIIILRQWTISMLNETFLSKCSLPLETIFYVMFAVQENYLQKQEQQNLNVLNGLIQRGRRNKVRISQLFLAQIYFYEFFLINRRMFTIELVFGVVCLSNFIWKRTPIR